MARKSVSDAEETDADIKSCDECGVAFRPRKHAQRFCTSGSCRQTWHRKRQAMMTHSCPLCGLHHEPKEKGTNSDAPRKAEAGELQGRNQQAAVATEEEA